MRRRLRHAAGEGSIVTHWPHCQVNATWVFYRRHCSRWHFECTSHTLSLSITHSLHFLGQPPRMTLSRPAALAENSLQDRVVVAAAAEVRGGDVGNDNRGFQSPSRRVSFFILKRRLLVVFLARSNWRVCLGYRCGRTHFRYTKKIDFTKNKEQKPEWGSCQENEVWCF